MTHTANTVCLTNILLLNTFKFLSHHKKLFNYFLLDKIFLNTDKMQIVKIS